MLTEPADSTKAQQRRTSIPGWAPLVGVSLAIVVFVSSLAGICLVVAGATILFRILYDIGVNSRRSDGLQMTLVMLGSGLALVLVDAGLCWVLDHWLNIESWRDRHLRNSRCPWCGYSIHGLPEPRCPECGEAWSESKLVRQP